MGSVSSHTIDTDKLTKSQAAELEDLLTHSDFFKLSNLRSIHLLQREPPIIIRTILPWKTKERSTQ